MKTKHEWIDDMELRLKRVLLDVMDLPEEESRAYLQQELRSHLEDVGGDESRLDYLRSLKERFPQVGDPHRAAAPSARVSPDPVAQPAESGGTVGVEEALAIVRRDWDQLSEEVQLEFIREFAPESEASSGPSESPPESVPETASQSPSDELARFLKLPADSELSTERLQNILVSLLKTVSQVDSLGTQVYKQVGLSRDIGSEDIRKLVGEYVGASSVELKHLNEVFDETRLKVGLIISSIADLPSNLSQSYLAKFQPSMIEQSVGSGGGFLAKNEAKFWKKYVTLAEDIQPHKVEKAINDLLVKQLKKLKRR